MMKKGSFPYGEKVNNILMKEFPEIVRGEIRVKDLQRKRSQLNKLLKESPQKYAPIIAGTIYFLKKSAKINECQESNKHELTDHGFCRILERVLNINLCEMKDLALSELKKREGQFSIARSGGKIITVWKK